MTVQPEDLAATLLRRKRADLAGISQRRHELCARIEPLLARAAAGTSLRQAWLIGSLVWGGFGARSDVDIVVQGLDPDAAVSLWNTLSSGLAAEVDLLRLEELPEPFAQRVQREGKPLRHVP